MPSRVAQSDPNPNSISTDTSQPLDTRAQNAALAAYNTAIDQLNGAQAKLDQMQGSARPADDTNGHDAGGKQWDKDYADASAAVADAKTQAAQSARQYATILQDQAKTAATDTSPAGQAKAAQAQAQADYIQAKADGYAATTAAAQQAAATRAQAALTRAQATQTKADTITTANGIYTKDDVNNPGPDGTPGWRLTTDANGTPLPGTRNAAQDALTTAQANLTQANADLAKATLPSEKAAAQIKVDAAQQALDQARALAPGAVASQTASTAETTARAALTQAQADLANATLPQEKAAAQLKVDAAQQALDAAKAQAPATLAGTEATTAATQASTTQTQQTTAQRNAPTVVGTPSATDRVITTRDPNTGALSTQPNPNTSDIGAQVQQLQTKAQTFRDNLQTQVLNGKLTQAEAQQQFNDFWNTQVEPQRQALVSAQQKDQFAAASAARQEGSAEEQNRAAGSLSTYNAGAAAGDAAVKRAMDVLPLQVGPQYGQHMAEAINGLATGHPTSNFSAADFTSNAPDLDSIYHQATAEALKHISPYAASQIGAPMPTVPQGVDINGMLNQSNYGGSFSGPPPSSSASSPTTQISPDGTVTIQHVPPYTNSFGTGSMSGGVTYGGLPVGGNTGGPIPVTPITAALPAYAPTA